MTSFSVRTLALSAALAIITAIPAVAATATSGDTGSRAVRAAGVQYAKVVCMTDEGQGRMKPCDAGFKRANPAWRGSDACMTDEGGGRMKPCDAGYKKKHSK
jgi:hypothetical protein